MQSVRARVRALLASLLIAGVGAAPTLARAADDAPVADALPMPAYAPFSAVGVMLETRQALLFDETSGIYVVVMVGDVVGGWKVVTIEAARVVVVRGAERDELALVPPPRPIEGVRLPKNTRVITVTIPDGRQVVATPAPAAPAPVAAPPKNRPPVPPVPVEDPTLPRKLTRQELNRELGDFERVGAAIDVTVAEGGGFRLTRVQPGSWPYRMGLRAGDVIRSVAGEHVGGVEDAARVYARLRTAKFFIIELDRPIPGIVDDGDPPTTRIVLQYHVK